MIPLAEMSRLAGRIFPCVHVGFFIPLAETKFCYQRLRNMYISVTQHNDLTIFAFFFTYLQEKALLWQDI